MTIEEAHQLWRDVFADKVGVRQWEDVVKRERVEQAKLLREAVWATVTRADYKGSDPKRLEELLDNDDEQWKAYYDSL